MNKCLHGPIFGCCDGKQFRRQIAGLHPPTVKAVDIVQPSLKPYCVMAGDVAEGRCAGDIADRVDAVVAAAELAVGFDAG